MKYLWTFLLILVVAGCSESAEKDQDPDLETADATRLTLSNESGGSIYTFGYSALRISAVDGDAFTWLFPCGDDALCEMCLPPEPPFFEELPDGESLSFIWTGYRYARESPECIGRTVESDESYETRWCFSRSPDDEAESDCLESEFVRGQDTTFTVLPLP